MIRDIALPLYQLSLLKVINELEYANFENFAENNSICYQIIIYMILLKRYKSVPLRVIDYIN